MNRYEAPNPANDNNDIYGKFEIGNAEWQRQCEEISNMAGELATLAAQAKYEVGGKAQVTRTIEMVQLAFALQEVLSQPRQHVGFTE